MNRLIVKGLEVNKNKVKYKYEIEGEWKKYFNLNELLFEEYDCDISEIPDSILYIPLLCNVIPISWLFDGEIEINEIDLYFFNCIEEVKNGFQKMYPQKKLKGAIKCDEKVLNKIDSQNRSLVFFSGGVDAFHTMLSHLDKNLILTTIWGSDIKLDDEEGWSTMKDNISKVAKDFSFPLTIIRSNFREFISNEELEKYTMSVFKEGWWHGFQCGIGLIGNAAPVAYANNCYDIYIASSFSKIDKGTYTCSSDPTTDNFIRFANIKVNHDGYDYCRQEKIKRIIDISHKIKKKIQFHVCWQSSGGKNCCICEKCFRTILGLIAEKQNPNEYGFCLDKKIFKYCMKMAKTGQFDLTNCRYLPIQKRLRENYRLFEVPFNLLWFYLVDIKNISKLPSRYIYRLKCIIKTTLWYLKKLL